MAYQPSILIAGSISLLACALYSLSVAVDRKSLSNTTLSSYQSYIEEAEILKARGILSQLSSRNQELDKLRTVCLKDIPESEAGTEIYQIQYCTDRSIRAMGFDIKLTELQKKASLPLPSDVLKPTCKVSLTPVLLYQAPVKEKTDSLQLLNEYAELSKKYEQLEQKYSLLQIR